MAFSRKEAVIRAKELHRFNTSQTEIRDTIKKEFPGISEKGLRAVVNASLYGADTLINAFVNDQITVAEAIVLARIPDVQIQDQAVQSLVNLGPEESES